MQFSILTFNLLYNSAYARLEKILNVYKPDIIILQEVETKEDNLALLEKFNYTLADYSNSFMYIDQVFGIATFYNKKKFKLTSSRPIWLSRGLFEYIFDVVRILKGKGQLRSILKTDFICLSNNKKLTIYNVHLSAMSTNDIRIKQIKQALNFYQLDKMTPTIIAGDFNYPYRRKRLEKLMNKYDLKEATRNLTYTFCSKKKAGYFLIQKILSVVVSKIYHNQYKLDYVYYKKLKLIKTSRINVELSDHFPILSVFEL